MKVYLLMREDGYDGSEVQDVFGSEEAAKAAIPEFMTPWGDHDDEPYWIDERDVR